MTKRLIHILGICLLAAALTPAWAVGGGNAEDHPKAPATQEQPATSGASTNNQAASAGATSTEPAPAAANPAASSPVPLEQNGLIVQIIRQVDRWNDSLEIELRYIARGVMGFPTMLKRFGSSFSDASEQAMLMRGFLLLAAIFILGLSIEWGFRQMLRRPRKALIDHAEQLEQDIREPSPAKTAPASDIDTPEEAATAGGMRPSVEGVALVRSNRQGIDQVEAVVIDAGAHAQEPEPSHRESEETVDKPANENHTAVHIASHKQWSTLRQLPFALGVLLVDLLPLAVFFFATSVLLHWLGKDDETFRHMVHVLIGAYIGMRAAMAGLRLIVAPESCGIPLLHVNPEISAICYSWMRRIIVTAAVGIALASLAEALGADMEERLAIMKVVSLLVHLFAVILIFKMQRPVARSIAAPANATGPLAMARNWLGRSWAVFAAILVMGVWVVWALGVEDGFPKLLNFIGMTAAVIIVARILAILLLGALGRMFHVGETDTSSAANPNARTRADRYYPMVQRLAIGLVSVCAFIALLQLWGFDVINWLTERQIGRMLLSAVLTIAIAIVVGIAVWEITNSAVERRLSAWNAQGDKVRAARLRTLLPILRTCLFIVIILVVGLTALNELGINTTPLLASASIVGVALGFGSQKLVQDFITGIFLLMENAMQVGEWVTVAGVSGTVEDLSIRTVRLRAGDGSLHIVPFSSVSSVSNSNRGLGNAVMRVSVVYGTDIDLVTAELKQIGAALRLEKDLKDNILSDLEIWGVDAVDGSTVTLAGQMRCTDKGRWGVQRELNRRILERFRELGIRIADPRATVLLPREATPPLVSAVQQTAPSKNANSDPA